MEMHKVKSSHVDEIGHDGHETMRVKYKGGVLYGFKGVSGDSFDKIKNSSSVGNSIRGLGIKGVKV